VNTLKEGGMGNMPAANPRSDDWKMLTLVGLADRLAVKTAKADKENSAHLNDARKKRWAGSKTVLRFILRKFIQPGSQAAAIRGLRDLDEARIKALDAFNSQMPDTGRLKAPSGAFTPATPEVILKAFCHVSLRVRATCIRANISDISWQTFRHVVAPQLAAHLCNLEREYPNDSSWPKDESGEYDPVDTWRRPSQLLRGVKSGGFNRRRLDSEGPKLSLARLKDAASKEGTVISPCCAKTSILLRALLQLCSDNDEDWERAVNMAGVLLRQMDAYGQQVHQGLGDIHQTHLNSANLAAFTDLACAPIIAELNEEGKTLDRRINLPQTRRRILSYAPLITDPSSAELDMDFTGAVSMIRKRINKDEGDEWARACMGYAYYMSRRCLITAPETEETHQASKLTYDLMERAFKTGNPDTQQIALRYLAGFATNPRFRCTFLAQHMAKEWVAIYKKASPKGMAHLFLGRLAFINGDTEKAIGLYQRMFVRALPKEFSDEATGVTHPLEDHEALAYLIPECYTLAGLLLRNDNDKPEEESLLQKQIRRAGVAHFGIDCDWPKEAERIKTGFEYRKGLLSGRVTPKS
jgi:tetratricopeptide (TPR) repeat protein